jgi:hypothetical protein
MKKIFRYLFAGMILTFLFINAHAQTDSVKSVSIQSTIDQKIATTVAEIKELATLTSLQAEQITPYATEFFKQKEADIMQYKGNTDMLKSAADTRRKIFLKKLSAVLPEPQLSVLMKAWKDQSPKSSTNTEIFDTE